MSDIKEFNKKNSKSKKTVWISLHCRPRKDLLAIQSFKKHHLIDDALFFTEEGVANVKMKKAKNLWPGMVFIKTSLLEGKIQKNLLDFLLRNSFFSRFYTYQHDYRGQPIVLSDREIKRILQNLQSVKKPTTGKINPHQIDFQLHEFVTILSGVFRGFEGEVVDIDYVTGIVTVSVEFFGRITPVQIGFLECKKSI